ncbi:MAG: extracellular solute-binding protein [Ruminococcus sp.]|nr:extracellular solute-binding protein [Ruminococcus sp.]
MKTTKKMLAALCALTFCVGAASCGNTSSSSSKAAGDSTSSTGAEEVTTTVAAKEMAESQKEQVASIAEKLDDTKLENQTVKFLSHWKINPQDNNVVPPDIQMFRDKYDGKFEDISTTWENRYTDLASRVMANEAPDMFSAMDMDGFPQGAIKSMFQPVDDYIDLDSDLWKPAKPTNDAFVYEGKHYVAAIESQPDIVCIYNKKVVEEKGYEDPAELYYKDEWTWSKFSEMCLDFADYENEIAALDGWWYAKGLGHTCGLPLIGMKDGQIVNNMSDPAVAKIQEKMYDLQKNKVCFDLAANNWQVRGNTYGQGVGSGETLFFPCGMWAIEAKPEDVKPYGDVEAGEVMFCPMPRMDENDKYYVTARDNGYFLCAGAQNPKGWAAYQNCRMLAKTDAADITEQQLKEDYKWNDDMIKMRRDIYALANENPVYEFSGGVSQELSDAMNNVSQSTVHTSDPKSWTQTVEENKNAVDELIRRANENLDEKKDEKKEEKKD